MHLRRPILFSIFDLLDFVLYYYYRLILFEKGGRGDGRYMLYCMFRDGGNKRQAGNDIR